MSTVTLTIGPKSYPVACADGQEAHIEALGALIAEKYAAIGTARAPLEAQNLLFAALFMADELTEARKQAADTTERDALRATIAQLEADLAAKAAELEAVATAEPAPAPTPDTAPAAPAGDLFGGSDLVAALADRLEALADRSEACAAALEAVAANA